MGMSKKSKEKIEDVIREFDEKLEQNGLVRRTGIIDINNEGLILEEYAKIHSTCTIAEFTGDLIMLGLKMYKKERIIPFKKNAS